MDWRFSEGAWRGGRGTEVGCCQGRNQAGELEDSRQESPAGHTRVWGRQGGRGGEYRAGVWAWARRTGGPGSGKLLARAVLAILRVSVQTNFRNFYFKTRSPLPLPHTQKHTLIHHVEILQTHLFKKIDSISLSARSVIFFFSYASKSPNVDTAVIWAKGKKKFLFASTASSAQATDTSYIFCRRFPSVSFWVTALSGQQWTRFEKGVHKASNCVGERTAPSTVNSCQCLELIGMDAIKIQKNNEFRAQLSQAPE